METSIPVIEQAINIPAVEWVNRCHEIASYILEAKLVRGNLRYGLFMGKSVLKPGTHHRHGWIELSSGKVYDPTRWCFEGADPYIFVGLPKSNYDTGMNALKDRLRQPCPRYDEPLHGKKPFWNEPCMLDLDPSTAAWVQMQCDLPDGIQYPTNSQGIWLANLSPTYAGVYFYPLMRAIIKLGQGAWIPQDNHDLIDESRK